jgi:hypothetical protein
MVPKAGFQADPGRLPNCFSAYKPMGDTPVSKATHAHKMGWDIRIFLPRLP